LLNRTELSARDAEICHAATFVVASAVAVYCWVDGQLSMATWILVFNIALNAYPVMLQRTHRWRVQRIRAAAAIAPMRAAT
jgi:glycosyl-4,4'-diaponeurosporenoate acyltransferase